MKICEKCSCGASVEAESADQRVVTRLVDKWRRVHKHEAAYYTPNPYRVTWNPGTTWTNAQTGNSTTAQDATAVSRSTTEGD